ncbi:GyrI-like domain-containing protein [Niabella sp. CC-SYL272]|uniref:GyrI-like domain-containing protein n=1 Tax=Niabella agricola TaxID=2891571 RepID=UPI001F3EDCE2|nr:GyrI-like domain-containing protein [Niabella agricola]MCF3111318.1 GyrI-like domain-containing protein [Niabella agricola]
MEKLDLTKQYRHYYTAKPEPALVTIEAAQFLSITGKGDPSGGSFKKHIEALYSTAYTLKFACKVLNKDFVVSKLEGLWWFDESRFSVQTAAEASLKVPRSEWEYRLLIRLPDFITKKDVQQSQETVLLKKQLIDVQFLELFSMEEGLCVQLLHQGPFATEPESLEKISVFMHEHNLSRNGVHHEIYLSDFNKTAPEKLKTILREPVK